MAVIDYHDNVCVVLSHDILLLLNDDDQIFLLLMKSHCDLYLAIHIKVPSDNWNFVAVDITYKDCMHVVLSHA